MKYDRDYFLATNPYYGSYYRSLCLDGEEFLGIESDYLDYSYIDLRDGSRVLCAEQPGDCSRKYKYTNLRGDILSDFSSYTEVCMCEDIFYRRRENEFLRFELSVKGTSKRIYLYNNSLYIDTDEIFRSRGINIWYPRLSFMYIHKGLLVCIVALLLHASKLIDVHPNMPDWGITVGNSQYRFDEFDDVESELATIALLFSYKTGEYIGAKHIFNSNDEVVECLTDDAVKAKLNVLLGEI